MIGRPYGLRRVAMLALVLEPGQEATKVSLDIEEGTLEDALEAIASDAADVYIVETADEEVR